MADETVGLVDVESAAGKGDALGCFCNIQMWHPQYRKRLARQIRADTRFPRAGLLEAVA